MQAGSPDLSHADISLLEVVAAAVVDKRRSPGIRGAGGTPQPQLRPRPQLQLARRQ